MLYYHEFSMQRENRPGFTAFVAVFSLLPLALCLILTQVAHSLLNRSHASHGYGPVLATKVIGILAFLLLVMFFIFGDY